ncbi:MAG: type II 3-dehydroquinate dehydratase [Bacteroidales bacterium]|nr:type II 3-dehydroquinate dehydratase [Bacteroidales bacterium]
MKISIINGPNLNLLGKREPSIYGKTTFESFLQQLKGRYTKMVIDYFQSNVEGEIINRLHEAGFSYHGIILNAGGYSHTSVSIADAVRAVSTPVIEVHLSNIYSREDYRHHSLIAPYAQGVILGFGLDSYRLAIESFMV